jgi:hypothetical protein
MRHFIDDKTPCLRKATRELVWPNAITKEYQYTLIGWCIRYYSRTRKRNMW